MAFPSPAAETSKVDEAEPAAENEETLEGAEYRHGWGGGGWGGHHGGWGGWGGHHGGWGGWGGHHGGWGGHHGWGK